MMKTLSYLIIFAMVTPLMAQEGNELIKYKKGACFGQCPVYNITVSPEGKLTYVGKRFVDKEGTYKRVLSKKEFRKLKRKFKRAKISKITMEENQIQDAASNTFAYEDQMIKLVMGTPKKLKKAEDYLLSLSPLQEDANYAWAISQKPKVKPEKKGGQRPGRIENANQEIIVELKTGVDIQAWLKKYHKDGISLKKKLTPNRELYLLSFRPRTSDFNTLLKKIKSDEEVDTAEANKKVEMRSRN